MVVFPNAKINIGLNITERRPDGYHHLETVFYPVGLCDVLDVVPSDTCSDYSFSTDGIVVDGDVEDNLIIKAYRLLQSEYPVPPVDITFIKQIPFGAGLGGGSSDAAFMLKVLNDLAALKLSAKKMEELAVRLGADCPVFIKNRPVYATGIGNVFKPLKLSLKGYYLLLVKPEVHVSTRDAYALVTPQTPEVSLYDSVLQPVEEWKYTVKNDFEKSVFSRYPVIGEIKEQLYDTGALYASMSGSGSSVYGIFKTKPEIDDRFDSCFVSGGELE